VISPTQRPLPDDTEQSQQCYTHRSSSATPIPPAGFEPEIPVNDQPQNHALDCTVTEIGFCKIQANIPYTIELNLMSQVFQ